MHRLAPKILILLSSGLIGSIPSQPWSVLAQQPKRVQIDGSSTVFPITQAAAKAYQQTAVGKESQISVAFSGTGAGFKKFCKGNLDIVNASRPILSAEMTACKQGRVSYIEVPIAFDALTVVVNPKNTWATNIAVNELKTMWEPAAEGKVNRWQQVRAAWPSRPLKLLGPGEESGTYDYFTEAVLGKSDVSRKDYIASEDDEVIAKGVMNDVNALGFFGYHYYKAHQAQLKALPINSGKGFVAPSPETVQKNQYQPLSRPLFIYINARSSQVNATVRKFVTYYLNNAEKLVQEEGYITLHPESYHQAKVRFYQGKVGTVFDGKQQQNLTLRQLLRKQTRY